MHFLVLPLSTTCILTYSVKILEKNIFGNLNETVILKIKFRNVVTCYCVATELLLASRSLPTETQMFFRENFCVLLTIRKNHEVLNRKTFCHLRRDIILKCSISHIMLATPSNLSLRVNYIFFTDTDLSLNFDYYIRV